MTRRTLIPFALALFFVGLASPALAQDNNWKIYAAAAYVSPLDSDDLTFDNVEESVEASDELGVQAGIEWRSKWFGIQLDYTAVTHDVEADADTLAEVDLGLIGGTVNFHLIHTKIIDFYFGPTVAYADWGDIEATDGSELSTDSETAFGLSVGLDLALIKTIAIVTGLRYIDLQVSADGEDLSVNPLIATVGVAFRF